MLIQPLKIGGAIQLEQNDVNFIQHDNNYIILRKASSVNVSRLPDVCTLAKQQASKTFSSELAALLTGHLCHYLPEFSCILASHLPLSNGNSTSSSMSCQILPHTARAWLAKHYGTIVIPAGDTVISYQCKRHVTHSINWKRQINNTCYTYFAVSI